MTGREHATQLRVGFFMAIGLITIALMVVYFGRFGDSIRGFYRIRVEYANASGIYKGGSVLLAGAKVGFVESDPVILPDMEGVFLNLKIYEEVKIPSAAEFSIGSSGLLGDRFVQIALKKGARGSPPIPPDAVIKGKAEAGFENITERAEVLLGDIQEAVGNINSVAEKLNSEVFKAESMENLGATMANLKTASASFAETSKKLDGVLQKVEGAVGAGEQTLAAGKTAADELKKTLADIRGLVQQAKQGKGLLGTLLTDRQMADNMKALVSNLREHGVLWYKDRAGQPSRER